MTVGKRLFEERARLGLSQDAFGKAGGVGKGAQINYEKDARAPDTDYLQGLAAIGVDVLYVVTGERRIGALGNEREAALLSAAIEKVLSKGLYDPDAGPGAFMLRVQEAFQSIHDKAADAGVVPGRALSDAELKLLSNYSLASNEGKRSIDRIASLEAGRKARVKPAEPEDAPPTQSSMKIKGHGNVLGSNNTTTTKTKTKTK